MAPTGLIFFWSKSKNTEFISCENSWKWVFLLCSFTAFLQKSSFFALIWFIWEGPGLKLTFVENFEARELMRVYVARRGSAVSSQRQRVRVYAAQRGSAVFTTASAKLESTQHGEGPRFLAQRGSARQRKSLRGMARVRSLSAKADWGSAQHKAVDSDHVICARVRISKLVAENSEPSRVITWPNFLSFVVRSPSFS